MDLKKLYSDMQELQAELRFQLQAYVTISEAGPEPVKALAAAYELSECLGRMIAEEEAEDE